MAAIMASFLFTGEFLANLEPGGPAILSCVEQFPTLRFGPVGKSNFGALESILCREPTHPMCAA